MHIKIKFLILTLIFTTSTFLTFSNLRSESIIYKNTQPVSLFSITNFSDFTQVLDSEYITSNNYGSNVNFSYHGITSSYPNADYYCYYLPDNRNCTDFNVEFVVQYNYTDQNDRGSLGFYLISNYTENGAVDTNSLGYIELWDGWDGVYGKYHIAGYPNNTPDSQPAAVGSMGTEGTVIFSAIRTGENLTLTIKNNSTEETLLSFSWLNGISRPLNMMTLHFHSGTLTSDIDINISDITGELTSPIPQTEQSTIPSLKLKNNLIWTYLTLITTFMIVFQIRKKRKEID